MCIDIIILRILIACRCYCLSSKFYWMQMRFKRNILCTYINFLSTSEGGWHTRFHIPSFHCSWNFQFKEVVELKHFCCSLIQFCFGKLKLIGFFGAKVLHCIMNQHHTVQHGVTKLENNLCCIQFTKHIRVHYVSHCMICKKCLDAVDAKMIAFDWVFALCIISGSGPF